MDNGRTKTVFQCTSNCMMISIFRYFNKIFSFPFQYGKNFEALGQCFNTRRRLVNPEAQKRTFGQIRCFYYRSFRTVSKLCTFTEGLFHVYRFSILILCFSRRKI
jgi:hypothetical protein